VSRPARAGCRRRRWPSPRGTAPPRGPRAAARGRRLKKRGHLHHGLDVAGALVEVALPALGGVRVVEAVVGAEVEEVLQRPGEADLAMISRISPWIRSTSSRPIRWISAAVRSSRVVKRCDLRGVEALAVGDGARAGRARRRVGLHAPERLDVALHRRLVLVAEGGLGTRDERGALLLLGISSAPTLARKSPSSTRPRRRAGRGAREEPLRGGDQPRVGEAREPDARLMRGARRAWRGCPPARPFRSGGRCRPPRARARPRGAR
jgi:hypothetical protein